MDSILESLKGTGNVDKEELFSSDKIRILVVGVGGGGCNTITRIAKMGIKSADTIAINTDMNHLKITEAKKRILIGKSITRGLGAGGFADVAKKCAEMDREKLAEAVSDAQLVFLCAGMGGGTGTGASPVVAELAKKEGAIVVGMVTTPFNLERARIEKAMWGLEELQKVCDTVVIVDNNRLLNYAPNLPMNDAFRLADEIVARAVKGISDTIMFPSMINIDYADVKSIMGNGGISMISVGEGKGNDKVKAAISSTLEHPLLDVNYEGAKGALIHIAGGENLTLGEATKIGEGITEVFDPNSNIIWGARIIPELGDAVTVTAIMTGVTSPQLLGGTGKEGIKKTDSFMEVEELSYL